MDMQGANDDDNMDVENARQCGFRAVKRKQKAKPGRGTENTDFILEEMMGDW